jgi:hypothetical protein
MNNGFLYKNKFIIGGAIALAIVGIIVYKTRPRKKDSTMEEDFKLGNTTSKEGDLIFSMPISKFKEYPIVIVFGGISYANPTWIMKEVEKEKVYTKEAKEIASNPWGHIKGVQKENINKDYPWNYSSGAEQNDKSKLNENNSIQNEKLQPSAMSAIMLACLSKTKNYETSIGSFYSKEAMSFAKGAEKVIKDMKIAGCPYQ